MGEISVGAEVKQAGLAALEAQKKADLAEVEAEYLRKVKELATFDLDLQARQRENDDADADLVLGENGIDRNRESDGSNTADAMDLGSDAESMPSSVLDARIATAHAKTVKTVVRRLIEYCRSVF